MNRRELLSGAAALAAFETLPSKADPGDIDSFSEQIFLQPYDKRSLWNARPISPVLDTTGVIPPNEHAFAMRAVPIFRVHTTDPPASINCRFILDELTSRTIRLPHFPANFGAGPGTDAEAVIYDSSTRLFHSFFGLKFDGSSWSCSDYAAENPFGFGFGTPARPCNIRASGTSPISGVLRCWELVALFKDPSNFFPKHALAVGFGVDAFLADAPNSQSPPGPIYPATLQDSGFIYTGRAPNAWPMGTHFMLPPSFKENKLSNVVARAIAKTLKTYGAYLIDASYNTCGFASEVPTGGNSNSDDWSYYTARHTALTHAWTGFDPDMDTIRASMRPVTSVSSWLDSDENVFQTPRWADMQLLSMRGGYRADVGKLTGYYDTARDLYIMPAGQPSQISKSLRMPSDLASDGWWMNWAHSSGWYEKPTVGRDYNLTAVGSGALTVRLEVRARDDSESYWTSKDLVPGQSQTIVWQWSTSVTCISIKNLGRGGTIRLEMVGL